jgi:hypothetical protein
MAWEVFTLVTRGASGAFLGDCFGFLFIESILPSGFQLTIQNLKKGQVDPGKRRAIFTPLCSKPINMPFCPQKNNNKG